MARSRNIKPAIMDNEDLAELDPLARLLFIYLWMLADREGRLEDRPKRIAAQALAYDRAADVEAMLNELAKAGFIQRYVAGGVACILVLKFTEHQAPHVREAASTLPSPEAVTAKVVPSTDLGSAQASPGSPEPGFLIPDSLIPDCGLGSLPVAPAPQALAVPVKQKRESPRTKLPDDFMPNEAGVTAAAGMDLSAQLTAFKNHHTAHGKTMADWQAAWRTWCGNAPRFSQPNARGSPATETSYQRSMRERVAEFAPSLARQAPNATNVIDMEIFDVPSIARN